MDKNLTVWRYVIWTPHTFFSGVMVFILLVLGIFAFVLNPPQGRTADECALFVLIYSGVAFLICWLPKAVQKMSQLKLERRLAAKYASDLVGKKMQNGNE